MCCTIIPVFDLVFMLNLLIHYSILYYYNMIVVGFQELLSYICKQLVF